MVGRRHDAPMNQRRFAGVLIGIGLLAGCGPSDVPSPAALASGLEGRWITVEVANATDTNSTLAVVDEDDPTRIVGAAQPSTVAGQSREHVRLFVPDDVPWMVTSNGAHALSTDAVDGWCGELPVTINLADGIVDAAVPAFVHSGPGNCLGPVPPIRMTLYLRDQSVMGIGWKVVSGQGTEALGVVSEQPTARCIVVPYDWALQFSVVEDFMDRPDRLADMGPAVTAADVHGDVALGIDIEVSGLPAITWTGTPEWWHGPQPNCPELPDPSETP